jgi:hypothetical protein
LHESLLQLLFSHSGLHESLLRLLFFFLHKTLVLAIVC